MSDDTRYLTIARVVRAHGVKGELACEIVTDYPRRFAQTRRVFIGQVPSRPPKAPSLGDSPAVLGAADRSLTAPVAPATDVPREYAVERARVVPHTRGGQVVLQLAGVADREAAEALRGRLVQVPVDEAWKLPKGQYYWHQIIGLEVVTKDGRHLGPVAEILETGANDVYVVRGEGGELLLPAIKDVVKKISPERGELLVELLPGME